MGKKEIHSDIFGAPGASLAKEASVVDRLGFMSGYRWAVGKQEDLGHSAIFAPTIQKPNKISIWLHSPWKLAIMLLPWKRDLTSNWTPRNTGLLMAVGHKLLSPSITSYSQM